MRIGVDFGSTYSAVSKFDESSNDVAAIALAQGTPPSIPSVVSIKKSNGKSSIGANAKIKIGTADERIFEAFKMLLTKTDKDLLRRCGYDDEHTPREITRIFLKSVLRAVLKRENASRFEELVICVPEIWNKKINALDGRLVLREILINEVNGAETPIDHVRIVTEPEAASAFFAYNYERSTKKAFNGHLLLIDYGGGTLDITLTKVISNGRGSMEIGYREGGGAGENHPAKDGTGMIGSAGFAYMQSVLVHALRDADILGNGQQPDYSSGEFLSAMRSLESDLMFNTGDIEEIFGAYGSYGQIKQIMDDEPMEFATVQYGQQTVEVTFQHLYMAYAEVIEGVLKKQLDELLPKVKSHIGMDPCVPEAGVRDDFKIAVVGGFGSFYLVKQQIADFFDLDPNPNIDLRTKNIATNQRELAISFGAALLANAKVVLQKTSRYSIGLCTRNTRGEPERLFYAIQYHQVIEPDKLYFFLRNAGDKDLPENRVIWGALHGNIRSFAIEFTDRLNCGGLMDVKQEILSRLKKLPEDGFWHCALSMDENDVVSFHALPYYLTGSERNRSGITIQLESYSKMFDLTAVREVKTK